MKSLLTILALCLTVSYSFSATCTSLGNGDWNDPLTWSCGTVPAPGDTIIINVGDTVTLNSTEILGGSPMVIIVNGYFLFDTPSAKLHLECGSEIFVSPTGEIASSGVGIPSHNIKICGQEVWQGFDGPLIGPILIGGPLPVELVSFRVSREGVNVVAEWETASEYNNDYFTLQGTIENESWNDLIIVEGAGTTDLTQYYSSDYDNRSSQFRYFRLKQTDQDGTSSFSKVVALKEVISADLTAFPNPINGDYLTLSWSPEANNASVTVCDLNGRVVESKVVIDGAQEVLNTSTWPSGYYLVQLKTDQGIESTRLIKP